jgi:general stress protein CsbA
MPARIPRIPPTSFQPHKDEWINILTIRKIPPTSQKKPRTCTKNNRVIPGAVNRKRPRITDIIPSSSTSHQGKVVSPTPSFAAVVIFASYAGFLRQVTYYGGNPHIVRNDVVSLLSGSLAIGNGRVSRRKENVCQATIGILVCTEKGRFWDKQQSLCQ